MLYGFIDFFLQIFTIHWTAGEGREGRSGGHFYSSLPLAPDSGHLDIYFQLGMRDDYHVSLITSFVSTRLLLENYYFISLVSLIMFEVQCTSSKSSSFLKSFKTIIKL